MGSSVPMFKRLVSGKDWFVLVHRSLNSPLCSYQYHLYWTCKKKPDWSQLLVGSYLLIFPTFLFLCDRNCFWWVSFVPGFLIRIFQWLSCQSPLTSAFFVCKRKIHCVFWRNLLNGLLVQLSTQIVSRSNLRIPVQSCYLEPQSTWSILLSH